MAYRESLIIYDHIEDDNKLKKIPEQGNSAKKYTTTTKVLFILEEVVILGILIAMMVMIK
jgi:hypothetical protein